MREHEALPGAAWILVGDIGLRSKVNLSIDRRLGGVAGHYLGLTKTMINRLHDNGQKAGVGFVPSPNLFAANGLAAWTLFLLTLRPV